MKLLPRKEVEVGNVYQVIYAPGNKPSTTYFVREVRAEMIGRNPRRKGK